jgi:ATPase family associated with various cellular activities (AAA)
MVNPIMEADPTLEPGSTPPTDEAGSGCESASSPARPESRPESKGREGDSPALNLQTYALAAVAWRVFGHQSPATNSAEGRYLLAHLVTLAGKGQHWLASFPDYLRRPASSDLPLLGLAGVLDLAPLEILSVALAAAVESDTMAGRALAHVQAPVGGSRPTLGLLAAAFADSAAPGQNPISTLVNGPAVRTGLLVLVNETAPLSERTVTVPTPLVFALSGFDGAWPGVTIGLGAVPPVPLPASVEESVGRHAGALMNREDGALVLRTGCAPEGRAVAAALARATGCRPAFIESDKTTGLGPWMLLRRLRPVFRFDLAPGERRSVPDLAGYHGPVLIVCGPDGSVETAAGSALSWALPVPGGSERERLWKAALGDGNLAGELARDHRHGAGRIAHLGRLARHHAAVEGRARATRADVVAASWSGEGTGLDALAQALPDSIPDEAFVMTPGLRAELEALLQRCRGRDRLAEGLGVAAVARYHPGVRALLVGPSGTGKTLAAGWLATRLGMPLYRVDLASVTSKYIGETEKNLAQLLARAEQAEVILMFDEADSLFGKRTDVKEANDRFANAQTNYLLQRIESYDGITLLTSNSRARFDAAFSRRLDFIVEFPMPGPEERRALWLSHLGRHHGLEPGDLNQLAALLDFGGGHIRNVVLAAAALARHGERLIEWADLVEGAATECRKLGRQLPAELGARSARPLR